MIALVLMAAVQPNAAPAKEVWEPRYSWGCVVSEGSKPAVVNGVIAQRNEPDHPNVHQRFQRALRVVRDDTGKFAGRQARPPMFVVHPKQYWAFFKGSDGKAFGPGNMSVILDKDASGRPVRIELYERGEPGAKPYAKGRCISRVLSPEIQQ